MPRSNRGTVGKVARKQGNQRDYRNQYRETGGKFLTRQEEIKLVKLAQSGNGPEHIAARNKVIINVLYFIQYKVGRAHINKSCDRTHFDEMVNECVLRLCKAFRKFDLKRGTRFTTFAHGWIWNVILQYKRDSFLIKVPSYLQCKSTDKHVAAMQKRHCEEADKAQKTVSMNTKEVNDSVIASKSAPVDHELFEAEKYNWFLNKLDRLPARSKAIMDARRNGKTLEEIGNELGITRERVRQVQDSVMQQLKRDAANCGLAE